MLKMFKTLLMKVTNLVNVGNIIKYVCSYGEIWQVMFCDISQIFASHQDHSSTFQSMFDVELWGGYGYDQKERCNEKLFSQHLLS
jgi:hypothetical protein